MHGFATRKQVSLREILETGVKTISLRLYIVGDSTFSRTALSNLENLAKRFSDYEFRLEVIDILENPDRATEEKVIATPTLVKHLPAPTCRVVGDLSATDAVVRALSLGTAEPHSDSSTGR